MLDRLTFEREVHTPAGVLEAFVPVVEGELPPRTRASAGVYVDFDKLKEYVKGKAGAADAPYLAIVQRDRMWIWYRGDKEPQQFPIQLGKTKAGHYLMRWDAQGRGTEITDLDTGEKLRALPSRALFLAGAAEAAKLRKDARRGVHWIQVSVDADPPNDRTMPDEFPLHKSPTVSREQAGRDLEGALTPLIIPYPTSDVWQPNSYQAKPLNFTYYTQNGATALVSRKILDEEYYYSVDIKQIFDYLKFYPISQAGKAGMGFVILYQLIGEIGIYFVPVIGPIYGLYQAGKSAHQLITNWNNMSGWEKALAMTDVVFAKFDIVKGARIAIQTAKGAKVVRRGVDALVAGGLPLTDAKNLLDAASFAAKGGARFKAVADLADILRKGGKLDAQQLAQVAEFYENMLKRLKPRDRLLAEAMHAMENVASARAFLLTSGIVAKHLDGLKMLDPESLVRLRETGKESPGLVDRVADIVASSKDAAAGVLQVSHATRPAHFAKVVVLMGPEVLDHVGRGMAKIPPQVGKAAAGAGKADRAYEILMKGLPRKRLPGLLDQLWAQTRLPSNLLAHAKSFRDRGMFLNEHQLKWYSGLSPRLQELLAATPHDEFLRFAANAENSAALGRYADELIQAGVKPGGVINLLNHVGPRMISRAEDLGVRLSPDLLRAAAAEKNGYAAAQRLLHGSKTAEGLLKQVADRIANRTDLALALSKAGSARAAGDLMAYWLLRRAKGLSGKYDPVQGELFGVAAVVRARPTDAREVIANIYRSFDKPEHVMQALGRVTDLHGDPHGLSAIIGDLAAGGDKSAGALFVLDFAANEGKKVTHIEYRVVDTVPKGKKGKLAERKYDLVAGGTRYEMKYWSDWTGKKVKSAVDEFMRDVVQHAGDFTNLRWVFSKNMQSYDQAIKESFVNAFTHPWVVQSLRTKGIKAADALANFRKELANDFFVYR